MTAAAIPKPILLIDMDGVIADYYRGYLDYRSQYLKNVNNPSMRSTPIIPPSELASFWLTDSYPEEADLIKRVTTGNMFFTRLEPMPGAIDALKELMREDEFEPYFCTAPDIDCRHQSCFSEKAFWIERHLGIEWVKRLVITKDKTLVRGHYLIDDKPIITGVMQPMWDRVIFDWKYNEHSPGIRLKSWDPKDWVPVKQQMLNQYYEKYGGKEF